MTSVWKKKVPFWPFVVVFHSGIHHVFQESSGIFLLLRQRERELKEKEEECFFLLNSTRRGLLDDGYNGASPLASERASLVRRELARQLLFVRPKVINPLSTLCFFLPTLPPCRCVFGSFLFDWMFKDFFKKLPKPKKWRRIFTVTLLRLLPFDREYNNNMQWQV